MRESSASRQVIRFGPFEADLHAGELRRQGLRIKLQEQPFQILAMLLERPGDVITREELQKKLWPADTFVDFDHGMGSAINKLRQALGDSAENPRYIETLPRRGFRFIAVVEQGRGTRAPAATGGRAWLAAAALVVALAVSGYFVWQRWHTRGAPQGKVMLVVLPFENLSRDPEQEFFSDGMTEEMITQLGGLEPQRLGVIARASAMQYKHSTKSAAQIGRELGVDYLLEGSARRADGRVRITAQLIQVRDQTHLWAASYERDLSDLLVLQNEVATAIAQQIQVQLTTQTQAALARARLVDEASQDAYLRGTFFLEKDTVDSLKKSIKYFQQAIDQDPGYAMPYVGLAKAYGLLANFTALPPGEAYPNSRAAATKALEIDETISEAHTQLAWTKFLYDRDWAGAERSFRRALALNPSNATAHEGYAMYFVAIGQPTEALAEIRRAEKLDPLSLLIKADKGWILYYARQPDEAINELLETIDMDPNFAITHFFLGQAYELKGMFSQAIAEFQKAITLSGGSRPSGTLGHVYAVSGKKGKALKVVGEQERRSRRQYVSPYDIALVYGALGDSDRAFAWLERAYQDRFWMMAFLKVDPRLDPVRSDPRYTDLLRRSGLVP